MIRSVDYASIAVLSNVVGLWGGLRNRIGMTGKISVEDKESERYVVVFMESIVENRRKER